MTIKEKTLQLKSIFSVSKSVRLTDTKLNILPFPFSLHQGKKTIQDIQHHFGGTAFCPVSDEQIKENKYFQYSIFTPDKNKKYHEAIILLHGLNERSWEKYLPWAEHLTLSTGKPVILFPIAFHMNRSPKEWSNPRQMLPWVEARKQKKTEVNSTFVNLAISFRIAENPLRFYSAGLETILDLEELVKKIKSGNHPLFLPDTQINLFTYSIGSFISQVMLSANRENLFSDSKLFIFCGGALLNHIDGGSRDIMDKDSYQSMLDYYVNYFVDNTTDVEPPEVENLVYSFRQMIREDKYTKERESFYKNNPERVQAITLKKDIVVPTLGVKKAIGNVYNKVLKELDFPYKYSHQAPFPTNEKDQGLVNVAFNQVFDRACAFL